MELYLTFGTGNLSTGREEEGCSLHNTAAYTIVNNTIAEALEVIYASSDTLASVSYYVVEPVVQALLKISEAQVAIYGTYELAASRYEFLCGRQGAAFVADPDLLPAFIDPPTRYSAAGEIAFKK